MQMQLLCFWMEGSLYTPKAASLEARIGSLRTSGFVLMRSTAEQNFFQVSN